MQHFFLPHILLFYISAESLAELRTSTNKHVDDITRQAGTLQEGLRRQAENIKVELRRRQALVFDEEEKLGGYFCCPVLALACVKKYSNTASELNYRCDAITTYQRYIRISYILYLCCWSNADKIHMTRQ